MTPVAAGFLHQFWGRVRHGLATQEILDRLMRAGLTIYPYFLVEEPMIERPDVDALGEGLTLDVLNQDSAGLVASVEERPRHEAWMRDLMQRATCVAVLENRELLAYSWFSRRGIVGPVSSGFLVELPPDGAYLFDAYVRPAARGRNIAVYMRHRLHRLLAARGVTRCFSITLAFNRSSRRFKSKLGARETELRLLLRVGRMNGVDLRLWRREPTVATPAVLLVPLPALPPSL